jgi:hypothetical protein
LDLEAVTVTAHTTLLCLVPQNIVDFTQGRSGNNLEQAEVKHLVDQWGDSLLVFLMSSVFLFCGAASRRRRENELLEQTSLLRSQDS